MAIFKSLTFDGINSLDYGIYITGEAVYNAPERVVEMVSVPGRNGSIAIDQGRFENIEVTYHAGCFADSQADFADKVMKFRNALASRYTYKKLTDEYHSDEYRLGLYKSGLEVDAVHYSTAGEFDITFDCKPQRFLTSGETALTPFDYIDTQTETGEIVTIDSDGSLGVKSLEVSLSPIQSGSGTPSPSNVRPISGRTEVVTQRTGKNLLDVSRTEIGTAWNGSSNSARARLVVPCVPNTTYTLSMNGDMSVDGVYRATASTLPPTGVAGPTSFPVQITTGASDKYIVLGFNKTSISQSDIDALKLQIELGTTATDYEPYNRQTYTTALGRTVYGGTLDVVSGALTVDRAFRTFNGSENWETINQGLRYYGSFGGKAYSAKDVSNMLTCATSDPTTNPNSYKFTVGGFINVGVPYTVAEWKSLLAANNLQIVYELATPQTYQLTPQQVTLLLGENHLWSDGEITVEYGVHPYYNPTRFESKPLLVVTGAGTLQIGDYVLTIGGTETQTIYIDCESQEAWEVVGAGKISRNDYIQNAGEEFPVLSAGNNTISLGSGISQVVITPRWWRI